MFSNLQNRLDAAMSKAFSVVSDWTPSTNPRHKYAPYITPESLAALVTAAFAVISGLFESYKLYSKRRRAVKKDGTVNKGINPKHNITKDVNTVLQAWLAGTIPSEAIDNATLYGISIELCRISFNEMWAFDVNGGRVGNLQNDAMAHSNVSLDCDGRTSDLQDTHSQDNYANEMIAKAYDARAEYREDCRSPLDILTDREDDATSYCDWL